MHANQLFYVSTRHLPYNAYISLIGLSRMVFKNPFTISLKNKNEDSKSYLQYSKRLEYKTREKPTCTLRSKLF